MYDGKATGVGDKGVGVHMFTKASNRLDIFMLLLVGSLHTISSNIEILFSWCHKIRVSGDSREGGAGKRVYSCNKV